LLNGGLILIAQKWEGSPKSRSECRTHLRRINTDDRELAITEAKLFLDLFQVP